MSKTGDKEHWERVYSDRKPSDVSWYQLHPEHSLALIENCVAGSAARIIDVGGGASTLVDHLLDAGYHHISVLDIARQAIRRAQARLGSRTGTVTWIEQDITRPLTGKTYDIWHDRAVFHFLTDPADRAGYIANLEQALRPGGHAIIATFAEDGPSECSGLQVVRYSPKSLSDVMGDALRLVETRQEEHHPPHGGVQRFIYCRFIRIPTGSTAAGQA
jgi:2-polyprenyl-3-methyl-5-hydroxy-6-metoxy-1,4-benzoquinol methylase